MHESSYALMGGFSSRIREEHEGRPVRVLDVGSMGVNGTYKPLFAFADYVGMDIAPGPNVDVVPADPYDWVELPDAGFDVIISGQALEHVEFPWLVVEQMARKLKPGGQVFLIVPSRGPQHRFPVDCYRYYPDGLRALAKWCGLTVLDVGLTGERSGFHDGSDQWGDCHCLLRKDASAPRPARSPMPAKPRPSAPHLHSPLNLPKNAAYYRFNRNDVLNMLVQQGTRAERVLELGCAAGEIGRQLKQTLGATYYAGIDSHADAVQKARGILDQVYLADIEQSSAAELGLKERDFDLLVALDVLEHLRDPWTVLTDLVRFLKPGGQAVFSIPNVQNITVLSNLAAGKWTYESAGLLDATHLRFFTLDSMVPLITGAGLTVSHMTAILNPALNVQTLPEAGNTLEQGKLALGNLTRDEMIRFHVYQYLVLARRNG
jgi:2-polyprenyl-3-methyl-5-hydroxy-6-metoxy-1,4-benzoquinol methylase